jgi:hypothetical protein
MLITSTHTHLCLWESINTDTQTDVPEGGPSGAICVQGFDDSLNSAIHTTLCEPRYPLLKVVFSLNTFFISFSFKSTYTNECVCVSLQKKKKKVVRQS